jgi:hypothetical protein
MTALVGADALAVVRQKIEDGFAFHGRVHRLLEQWQRLDDHGIPGGGELVRSWPLRLDDMSDEAVASIAGLDGLAIPLAQAEVRRYFTEPGRVEAAAVGSDLDAAVRLAVGCSLGYGVDAAIWASSEDEGALERSGALGEIHPEPLCEARWHHARVIYDHFLPAGALWVAGQDAATMTFHADADGRRVHVAVRREGGVRILEVDIRMSIARGPADALSRIDITHPAG